MNPLNLLERLFNSRALERELSNEKSKVVTLELKVNTLTLDNEQLREKLQKLEANHNSPLEFDETTGTWIDKGSELRYCGKCKPQILSPLKKNDHGWECPICTKFFSDPEKPRTSLLANRARFRTGF